MKIISVLFVIAWLITACGRGEPSPVEAVATKPLTVTDSSITASSTPSPFTPSDTETPTPSPTATPIFPVEGYGPQNYPRNVNPLTGLSVSDASLLDKRPVAIKINIVPRTGTRPPWGLSSADIVYDYYQNNGYTRFHAIFYGEDAELVGSIRSARFPDHFLIRMHKSIFAYGSADPLINKRLFGAEYSDRLVLEGGGSRLCPPTSQAPLCRFDPQGYDFLLGGTSEIHGYINNQGVDDSRQNLDGMYFNLVTPTGGQVGSQAAIRYSGDDYVTWEYDPSSGKYLRFQDDSYDLGQGETYAPLTDRTNEEQISADNVVVVLMEHSYYRKPPAEIVEILVSGSGPAYLFRDGKVFEVRWNIPATDSVLFLTDQDGNPFPYKPGNTWYQVVGQSSTISNPEENTWRFEFLIP